MTLRSILFLGMSVLTSVVSWAQAPPARLTSVGVSPLLIPAVLVQTALLKTHTDEDLENDQPLLKALEGSVYLGSARGTFEDLFGVTWYDFLFDISWQHRIYLDDPAGGPFVGTFSSAEIVNLRLDQSPEDGLTIGTAGRKIWSAGVRLGGNFGWRFRFGSLGITPQIGMTLPLEWVWTPSGLTKAQAREAQLMVLACRILEIGLTFEAYQ